MSIAILGFGIERLLTAGSTRDYQKVSATYMEESNRQDYIGQIDSLDTASGDRAQTSTTDTVATLRPKIISMSVGDSDIHINSLSYRVSHSTSNECDTHNHYP